MAPDEFGFVEAGDIVPGFAFTPVLPEPLFHFFQVDSDVEGPSLASLHVAHLFGHLESFPRDVLVDTADVNVVHGAGDTLHLQRFASGHVGVFFGLGEKLGHARQAEFARLGHVVGVVQQAAWNVSEEKEEEEEDGVHVGTKTTTAAAAVDRMQRIGVGGQCKRSLIVL